MELTKPKEDSNVLKSNDDLGVIRVGRVLDLSNNKYSLAENIIYDPNVDINKMIFINYEKKIKSLRLSIWRGRLNWRGSVN